MSDKKDLETFLVKRFLIIIIEIAVLELFLNTLYSYVVFPYLKTKIGGPFFENLGFSGYGSSTLYITFFQMLLQGILSFFPKMIADPISRFTDSILKSLYPDSTLSMFQIQNGNVMGLYYLGCLIITILLLLILIFPYVMGAFQFSILTGKEMKKIVEDQKKEHREYERKRNLMLSDIAHDLKTPITTVSGYAQALRDGVVEDEERKKQYLNAICNKAKRVDDLISLLFEYVKIDSEGFVLHKEKTDVAEVVRENIALYYADFERSGIELVIDLPEEQIGWELDKIQFSRALANLLTNDLRHVSAGNKVIIRLRYDREEEKVEILLGDTGKQIDSYVAEHIFEPFVMGDASRSTKGGSGLGLSISSKIVKMHGGILYLDRNSTEEYTKAFVIVLH